MWITWVKELWSHLSVAVQNWRKVSPLSLTVMQMTKPLPVISQAFCVFWVCSLEGLEENCPMFWRRQWHPTPVLLPGKSHGWRSLVGCSPQGHKESDTTERLHFHFSLSCIGEGNGNPLHSVLAWRTPGTGEPGGLPSTGSHRVRHDWSDLVVVAQCLEYFQILLAAFNELLQMS